MNAISSKFAIVLLFSFCLEIHAEGLFNREPDRTDIGNLRASILPDKKSAYLVWDPPAKEEEIIIARSNSIIDTPEKLYVADSLGRFFTGGKNSITNLYDYNLKPGSYYYAIVSVDDVRKRKIKLLANQNFTTDSVDIDESSPEKSSPLVVTNSNKNDKTKSIGALFLKAEMSNIRLNWVPPWNAISGQTVYSIYRSQSPMSTLNEMKKADKLAEISHPVTTYLDQDLEKSQTLYYGVSVKESGMDEVLPLEKGKSFVRIFYIKDKRGQTELVQDTKPSSVENTNSSSEIPTEDINRFQVQGFGYERVGKGATLKWNPPVNADGTTQYSIYASTRSFDSGVNSFTGGSVLKVGVVSHPKLNLAIKEIKPVESLYFAITAKKSGIAEDFNVVEGSSYFRYIFDRDIDPELPKENQVANNSSNGNDNTTKTNPTDVPKFKTEEEPATVEKPTETNKENLVKNPDDLTSIVDSGDFSELDKILRETYAKKKYKHAVSNLHKYLQNETDIDLRGKAYFYAGMSYFRMSEYNKALSLFLKKETHHFNHDRAIFWKNQTLSKLGRGN
ncbi:tetratricopeptide repeat protein [Leptospira sp. GIMC2001]|uniref:tetratricopeptide repeat protein n=1 Tax=Leptospira sp. GIMC2001 TaxID=1513297 RepID=UPI00234931F5|nr:tetratricopeptide repeat protein [Leptospira sp. GIMC2001]WCL48447.1 tetratricopeptide repeat protein [Leptospira sp. GIMC2001]